MQESMNRRIGTEVSQKTGLWCSLLQLQRAISCQQRAVKP